MADDESSLFSGSKEALKLDHQLCFAIYACSKEIINLYRPLLEPLGITYPQYLVLLVLWEKNGLAVKELGEKLYLDSGTLTPLLKRMEAAGFIERKRSTEDERKVLIHLTEKGMELKQQASDIPEELFKKSGLSASEYKDLIQEFKSLLQKVCRSKKA
ncbi:MarR family transcriptional regulator [Fictibacillus sp. Mic-4]|uniref:MarR family winged helix-turn-helix transcriptional regulator n=1 Tax=Fictibacillus sp. Mic-4 TaxID=3132826 RepID=UPI003CF482E4